MLLCHALDRLARRYAYQVLLLEELGRSGVEAMSANEPGAQHPPQTSCCAGLRG